MHNLTNGSQAVLNAAVEAARAAGDILRKEFNRPGGPRGTQHHAEADEVAEQEIYNRLSAAFPDYAFIAEENHSVLENSGFHHLWLVDPNDGTSAYMRGFRGAAVCAAGGLHLSPGVGADSFSQRPIPAASC